MPRSTPAWCCAASPAWSCWPAFPDARPAPARATPASPRWCPDCCPSPAAAELAELGARLAAIERLAASEIACGHRARAIDSLPEAGDPDVLEGFRQEAAEHAGTAARLLRGLARDPGDLSPLAELRRVLHTFKGAAAVVGFARLAALCHRLEDLAEETLRGQRSLPPLTPLPASAVDALFEGLAEMETLVLGELPVAAGQPASSPAATDRPGWPPPPGSGVHGQTETVAESRPPAVPDDLRRL